MNKNSNSQRGFSLIELLIAMTVTIVIAGIASTLVAQSFRMRTREDARSDAIADAHRALNIVSREIANSGFGLPDNGIVTGDTGPSSIRFRANLNAYTTEAGASSVRFRDPDEDIKYSMYHDDAADRHYLVRYDVTRPDREGITVLANRLDTFSLTYYDMDGNTVDVLANTTNVSLVWKVMIEVGVTLPAIGVAGSAGLPTDATVDSPFGSRIKKRQSDHLLTRLGTSQMTRQTKRISDRHGEKGAALVISYPDRNVAAGGCRNRDFHNRHVCHYVDRGAQRSCRRIMARRADWKTR